MISVLTLTYKRKSLLEEAIHSFCLQNRKDCEMVIINDQKDVKYYIDVSNVRIYNVSERFSSISKKLEWGFKKCNNEYIYRLDDDDLLYINALDIVSKNLDNKHDIFRSKESHSFVNNKYNRKFTSINTGNVYTKNYLNAIDFGDISFGEDSYITFKQKAKIKNYEDITMIYRWGMKTYHVSKFGGINDKIIDSFVKEKESERIKLIPHFAENYYEKIPS